MDASAFESSIQALERSIDSLEVWLFVASIAVVLGVVIECTPLAKELLVKRRLSSEKWIELVGGTLVTLGVAGELFVNFLSGSSQAKLRDVNHRYVAALQAEIIPRKLTPGQEAALITALAPYAGKTVSVQSYALDLEGMRLGQQLISVLDRAHLKPVNQLMYGAAFGSIAWGLHMSGKDQELGIAAALSLKKSDILSIVDSGQVPVTMSMGLPPVDADEVIFVGAKPLVETP